MLKEYLIEKDQFFTLDLSNRNKIMFCSLFIPIKNRKRRKRFLISKTIFIEKDALKYENYIISQIRNSEIWIKKFLQKSLNEGVVNFVNKKRLPLTIDVNRLGEIEFVTKELASRLKIDEFVAINNSRIN